jgi:hypothetical protein
VERKLLSPPSLFETTRDSPSDEFESAIRHASLPHQFKKNIAPLSISRLLIRPISRSEKVVSTGAQGNATNILPAHSINHRSSPSGAWSLYSLRKSGSGRDPVEPLSRHNSSARAGGTALGRRGGLASCAGLRHRSPAVYADSSSGHVGIILAAAARCGRSGIIAGFCHRLGRGIFQMLTCRFERGLFDVKVEVI